MHFASDMFESEGKLKPDAVPIRSSQTVDGPSESSSKFSKSPFHRQSFVDDEQNDDGGGSSDPIDESKLVFLLKLLKL